MLHTARSRNRLIAGLPYIAPNLPRAVDSTMSWRCQDVPGNSVCFLFVAISRLVNLELGLDHSRFEKSLHLAVADRFLKKRNLVDR